MGYFQEPEDPPEAPEPPEPPCPPEPATKDKELYRKGFPIEIFHETKI